ARMLAGRACRGPRDPRVRRHAAPERYDLAAVPPGDLAEHAQTVDVRREHGDDHGLRSAGDDGLERLADALFAAGRAEGVDVRRVAEEEVDAFSPELAEAFHVEQLAVGRGVVELEVAG